MSNLLLFFFFWMSSIVLVTYFCPCSAVRGTDRESSFLERLAAPDSTGHHRGLGGRGKRPSPGPHLPVEDDGWEAEDETGAEEEGVDPDPAPGPGVRLPIPPPPPAQRDAELDHPVQHRRQRTQRVRLSGERLGVLSPVCPSRAEWKQLRSARDINNSLVDVFQPEAAAPGDEKRGPQWFYQVSCRNHALQSLRPCQDCCLGIDNTRYSSSCQQKQSYVMAYVRSARQTRFHHSWILVNSSCSCGVASLHDDL